MRAAPVPVIGILSGNSARQGAHWDRMPPGVVEWITSPVDASEAMARINAVLSTRTETARAPMTPAANGDRYQFAFDGSLDELVVVDPKSGRILEINATFAQRSGFSRAQVLGARIESFDAALSPDQRAELNLKLGREGSVQVRAQKPRVDDTTYPIDLHVRLAVQHGRLVHFYTFREVGELGRYQHVLGLLARITENGGGDEGVASAVRSVVDWLALDFALLVQARPEQTDETQTLMMHHRFTPAADSPDPVQQSSVKTALDGKEVVQLADAWKNLTDDGSCATAATNA